MVIVTVKIKNGRKKPFNTDVVSVNLAYGSSGKPGKHVSVPGMEGFGGTLAKGRSRSAEYAFAVPKKGTDNIVVLINRGLKYPPAVFAGKAS